MRRPRRSIGQPPLSFRTNPASCRDRVRSVRPSHLSIPGRSRCTHARRSPSRSAAGSRCDLESTLEDHRSRWRTSQRSPAARRFGNRWGRFTVRPTLVSELTIQIVKEVKAGANRAAGAAHPSWDFDSAMCCSALARALSTRGCGASSRSVTMLASNTA